MKNYFFILSIILFFSCKTTKPVNRVIKLEVAMGKERVVSLSEIAFTIKYIQLETNDSSLVGNITPVYHNNYFYVIDAAAQVCRIFEANGKYVGNLGNQGRAAGEYIMLGVNSLSFDHKTGNVFLYSANKIIEYSPTGLFIREIPAPSNQEYTFNTYKMLRFNNGFAVSIGNMSGNNDLIFIDNFGNSQSQIPLCYTTQTANGQLTFSDNSSTPQVIALPAHIFASNDKIKLLKPDNDTIFSYNNLFEKEIDYIIDFGQYKTPPSCTDIAERLKYIQLQGLRTVETPNYIFLTFLFGKNAPKDITPPIVRGIYDKTIGKLQLLKRLALKEDGLKNDIDNGKIFWPQYYSNDGYLLMAVYPQSGDDNPSIMMVK